MNRNIASALAMGTATAVAALAAAVMTCGNAFADDITIESTPFVSSLSRDEVNAELKVPYVGGNPWSGAYNMFLARSTTTSEQASGACSSERSVRRRGTTPSDCFRPTRSRGPAVPSVTRAMRRSRS